MSLVSNIKQLCDKKGIKLETLGKELGLGEKAIYKWDKSSPKIDTLQKVADYFNVTIDSLLGKTFVIEPNNEVEQIMKIISNPDNVPYILISAEAKKKGLSPDTLKKLIDIFQEQNKKG